MIFIKADHLDHLDLPYQPDHLEHLDHPDHLYRPDHLDLLTNRATLEILADQGFIKR